MFWRSAPIDNGPKDWGDVPAPDAERTLSLTSSTTCGFCHRVIRAMRSLDLDLPIHDVHASSEVRDTLFQATGRTQVPCLFVDGVPLLESLDIIEWLTRYRAFLSESDGA